MELITLGEVRSRVEEQARNHWDSLIPVPDMEFQSLDCLRIHNEEHRLRPLAQREFANRLGVPYHYLQKCEPELQARNLNHWLEKETNEELFLRFDNEEIRAVFTPRYQPVDHLQIIDRLLKEGYREDLEAQLSLDEELMHLSLPNKEKAFYLPGQEEMHPGIAITNSEVGLSSLAIAAFVLRLICTNGLISQTSVDSKYRHVSTRILEELPQVLQGISQDLDRQKDQWRMARESQVENPEHTLKSFNRQFQLREMEQDAVLQWAWPQEQGHTMFHVINTYTKAAQAPKLMAESAYRLQKVGGSILAMLN